MSTVLERQDFPATLDGELEAGLSRWLWLVKWIVVIPHIVVLAFVWLAVSVVWLLAVPHYIVVGIFFGGAGVWNAGLVGVLVLVAGVVLLFAARYPLAVFDFVMRMNRWGLGVGAYALLKTDEISRVPPRQRAKRPAVDVRAGPADSAAKSRLTSA